MKISDLLKKITRSKSEKLDGNPDAARYTFISDDDKIQIGKVQVGKIWFYGNGDELLNYYTEKQAIGFFSNPIYNRNKRNYFWSLSAEECDIKRVHSGIPYAIISTISNIVGMPDISVKVMSEGKEQDVSRVWDRIEKENHLTTKLTQQGRPLTLAEGYGAWKPNIRPDLCDFPIWEYYDGEDVRYIYDSGLLVGIVYLSYYQKKNDNYVLFETRYKENNNSYIKYELFKKHKDDTIEPVSLDTIDELKDLQDQEILHLGEILGVASRYFYDPLHSQYGRSIYEGKFDLFDDLDQILSQDSQTVRVSTPVEYYSPDVLERDKQGHIGVPKLYNRQFVQKAGIPDGEGNMSNDIITTQPSLDFDKYSADAMNKLDFILTGVLSPATLGIEVAKKDNAEAQREKEKITIQTRNNIIASETIMIDKMVKLSLYLQEYIKKGKITLNDYQVSIKYNEFANPSFENELQILGPAWNNGQLSTKQYVDLLWADKLSDDDKTKEIEYLESQRQQDQDIFGGLDGNEDAESNSFNLPATRQKEA